MEPLGTLLNLTVADGLNALVFRATLDTLLEIVYSVSSKTISPANWAIVASGLPLAQI